MYHFAHLDGVKKGKKGERLFTCFGEPRDPKLRGRLLLGSENRRERKKVELNRWI